VKLRLRLLFFLILTVLILFFIIGFIKFYNDIKNYKSYNKILVEGIAVLTGGKGRIDKGIELFKASPNNYLIISGVDKSIKIIEVVPKDILNSNKVFIDRKSETTIDNAEEIIKWSRKNSITNIRIITSDYHMPRSMLILSKKSESLNFFPDPVKSDINIRKNISENFKSLLFLSEEYLKYLFCHLVL